MANLEKIKNYGSMMKFITVVDALLSIIGFWSSMWWMGFLIIIPIIGYCSAKYYQENLVAVYGGAILVEIVANLVMASMSPYIIMKVVYILMAIIRAYIMSMVYSFYSMLISLIQEQREFEMIRRNFDTNSEGLEGIVVV